MIGRNIADALAGVDGLVDSTPPDSPGPGWLPLAVTIMPPAFGVLHACMNTGAISAALPGSAR